jgi:hypothetical protein
VIRNRSETGDDDSTARGKARLKRGKMLGGKPPRRGGRLTNPAREKPPLTDASSQLLVVLIIAFLVLGMAGGFIWALDRQLRGGLLAQRQEALQRPDWIALESLPPDVTRAFLLVVDPRFAEGSSPVRAHRPSLPRELVRQIHLLGDGLTGRMRELVMAPLLEFHITQRDIVEFYLNRVHLGRADDFPIYGVHHAASEYLQKEPSDLTLAEAATLAGLLLEPRIEAPAELAGAVGIRRNEVLRAMFLARAITAEKFEDATGEPLAFQPGLAVQPMSLRIPSSADTTVIRLPASYPLGE